jgi:hypothetical protein
MLVIGPSAVASAIDFRKVVDRLSTAVVFPAAARIDPWNEVGGFLG